MAGFFELRTRRSQITALQISHFEFENIRDALEHYLSGSFTPAKHRAQKMLNTCNDDIGQTLDLMGAILNGLSPWKAREAVIANVQRRFAAQLGLQALTVEHKKILAATNVERAHLLKAMSMLDI